MMIEEDLKANEQQPASIKDFKDNSPYEIHDTPGQEVVKLVRTYNDEKITVSFSISDITNYDPFNEDPALEDDEMPEDAMQNANQQRGVQSTGGARSAQTQEQMERDMESEEGEEEDMDEAPAPISLSIVVEKPGRAKGALNVEATAQDGHIVVDNVYYYDAAVAAHGASPEGLEKRAGAYAGPPFGSLDEDLQVLLERFLEERGIDQSMAVFVPDYVDAKEQAEYTRWLSSVKGFVDA
ncbi:hypothetical protein HIM_03478 [Hirsutella minnesotensis 3608]|uniref:Mitochondrial acidic protein MAM33 n=1 Tax=Hirsutella minnesotensis 3608 TaxID=1043627 RepID=A0A0F8A2Q4_9HYPO|nr:hypothetical protein HIM_03478 [Hirsutella minnesotensis 3608]